MNAKWQLGILILDVYFHIIIEMIISFMNIADFCRPAWKSTNSYNIVSTGKGIPKSKPLA